MQFSGSVFLLDGVSPNYRGISMIAILSLLLSAQVILTGLVLIGVKTLNERLERLENFYGIYRQDDTDH